MPSLFFRNILFILALSACTYAQAARIEGIIYDKSNGQPLSYATIQLKATTIGTITNNQGRFALDIPQGEHALVVSYIGYKTIETKIRTSETRRMDFFLEPLSIILPEIIIGSKDEDPSYRIIRNAIKNKNQNRKNLNSLEYDEYRKAIFKSAGKIASIEESFLKGYKIGDEEKDLTLALLKTENIKKDNKQVVGFKDKKTDFYKDTLDIIGTKMHLPLSVNAFDYYDFKLLNARATESKMVYFIEVIPRSQIRPLFQGMVLIEDSTFALVGVDLKSNKGLTIPFLTDLNFRYTERKLKIGDTWFPQYLESHISVGVNLGGLLSVERMDLEQFRSFSNQKINYTGIDSSLIRENNPFRSLAAADSTTADSLKNPLKPVMLSRAVTDSLRPVPLNDNEIAAYSDLDGTKKPLTMLKTGGVVSNLIDIQKPNNSESGFFARAAETVVNTFAEYITFRNNRTGGIGLGARYDGKIDTSYVFGASGLYSFGLKKPEAKGYFGFRTGNKNSPLLTFSAYSHVKAWNENSQYTEFMNSFAVTLGLEDIFNYYRLQGYGISVEKKWDDKLSVKLGFVSEKQSPLNGDLKLHRIVNSRYAGRVNPPATEGMDNRLALNFVSGSNPFDYQFMPQSGFVLLGDLSLKEFGGDFGYLRLYSVCQIRFNTIFRELLFPPFMVIRLEGGAVRGNYGLQHMLNTENSLAFVSPFGAFKGLNPYDYFGDKMAALHAEHNWRGILFQNTGLRSLAERNIGIVTGGSILKMWNDSDVSFKSANRPVYWEVYGSITGIYGVIRLDGAYTSHRIFVVRGGVNLNL